MTKKPRLLLSMVIISLAVVSASAQSANLLQNPNADHEAQFWQARGKATVEEESGNRSFVVRNGGAFYQDVTLPHDAAGKYVVFIGRGSSERKNADGSITDLPYLNGYMLKGEGREEERILAHLQNMLGQPTVPGEWVKMSGVFEVPAGATKIRFFLNQALARGVERDGSAARFDDVGLYIFPTEREAIAFARR